MVTSDSLSGRAREEEATPTGRRDARVGVPHPRPPAERRVLVVAPQPFYEDRGTPIAVRHLLLALSQLGYRVDVLTYPVGSSPDIPGVRYHRVANPLRIRSVPIGFSLRKVWLDIFVFFSLRRMLRRASYTFVHAVEEAAFLAVLAVRGKGIPVIYDMQSCMSEQLARHPLFGFGPLHAIVRACERWLIRRADRIAASAGLARLVRAVAPRSCVHEWHYPTLVEPRDSTADSGDRLGIEAGKKLVVYTGNFEDYQGLSLLVAAASTVVSRVPEAVFVLVGGNRHHTDKVARELTDSIPAESYRLVPRQPSERIPGLLARADIVVSPRVRGNNLPIKVLQYLAAGCAIVATSIPAHRTVLNEYNAVLVEPASEALAEGIVGLLQDPGRLRRLKAGARGYAQQNLGWRGFVQEVRHICEGTTGTNGRPEDGESR